MNRTKWPEIGFMLGAALLGALTGCIYPQPGPPRVYVPPPQVEASVSVGLPGVEIRAESDFYEPLSPYGRWEVVGSYGRCWIPGRVEAGWRPYSEGNWQRTDAGWYWASDEPWGWATYHYGRWDLSAQLGWYWVPQTQWAPAWVSWHSGCGYVGWAPLSPSSRFGRGGSLEVDARVISPRAYVFVEERHFLEPVRRSTVVVNNTTIINKTVNITNVKVVNNTVINEGPRTQVIEQASGHKVQAVPVRELRRKQEAEVVVRQRATQVTRQEKVQAPVRSEAAPRATKAQQESQQRTKESEARAQEQLQRSAKDAERATQLESQRRAKEAAAKAQEESQRNAKGLEKKAQQELQQRAKESEKQAQVESQKTAKGLEKKAQRVSEQSVREKAYPGERGATQLLKKDLNKKDKWKPSPPENPPVPRPPSP